MELKDYIYCYPNLLDSNTNLCFHDVCLSGILKFQEATIVRGGQKLLDKDFRSTKFCDLRPDYAESMTKNHWARYLRFKFQESFSKYDKDTNCTTNAQINDIQV